ncbi:MAG: xanthine dehydrogenase family protein subunit M [Gemmatimonadetes bacterium]|nr:xanthine dehydrogenase family protein subunit M [Gemmatimonadota bacterium]
MPVQSYHTPDTWEGATVALAHDGAVPSAGGTDLVPLMRAGITDPDVLVDLRHLPSTGTIEAGDDGSLRLGAAVTLDALARHELVCARFPALAQAAASVGSQPLRDVGTLGGNLCQHVRCWYFRGDHPCLRRGGSHCSAEIGENQYHAIFRSGACVVAHPSDCAVALVALDAMVHVRGPAGQRRVPAADFLVPSSQRMDSATCLGPGEVVEAVTLPPGAAGGTQLFHKQMQRAAWDFALVSVAATKRRDGEVRLVLGGVANTPWRVTTSIEEDVASGGLSDDDIETLAQRALYDATPLAHNAYKLDLASAVLCRAMARLSRD